MEDFLIGECGKTLYDVYHITPREHIALVEGHKNKVNREYDICRRIRFEQRLWQLQPKDRPKSYDDIEHLPFGEQNKIERKPTRISKAEADGIKRLGFNIYEKVIK